GQAGRFRGRGGSRSRAVSVEDPAGEEVRPPEPRKSRVFLSLAARGGQLLRWVAQPIRPAQRRNRLCPKGLMGCIAPATHTQPLQLSPVTQPHDARWSKSRKSGWATDGRPKRDGAHYQNLRLW